MLVVGRFSDASGERARYVAGLVLAAALGFLATGIFDKNVVFLVSALAVLGGGVVASIPAFWTLPPKILTGAGAASGIALINTIGQLGGIVESGDGWLGQGFDGQHHAGALCYRWSLRALRRNSSGRAAARAKIQGRWWTLASRAS